MTNSHLSRLVCAGCKTELLEEEPYPFRCPNAGKQDDIDHVVTRVLDIAGLDFPTGRQTNPFVRYRSMFHGYHRGRAAGLSDTELVSMIDELDMRVAAVEGHGFTVTPLARSGSLASAIGMGETGDIWIKDETANVAGSHKARHIFGIALELEIAERLGRTTRSETNRRGLAIASCGNAALAAATVARALDRPLTVFIPQDADRTVVQELTRLGATISVCPRVPGETGDPCYLSFARARATGALPFCCQGNENGLTIEGGSTLIYEMVSTLVSNRHQLDRIFIQVGGGALASACIQGLQEAMGLCALSKMPRVHTVQTSSATPLRRAYENTRARILEKIDSKLPFASTALDEDEMQASLILSHAHEPDVQSELHYARSHRSEFMWPWEKTPRSIAHGILDDETYDWAAVVKGMIESGGYPVTVSEERLAEAVRLARSATDCRVDATGAAGLAGLLELRLHGLPPAGESMAVLFTGGECNA